MLEDPDTVEEYLKKEIRENEVASPFPAQACVGHVSRFGVIPKSHQPNKWPFIFDLSSPKERSIDAGVPKELCSMSYITVDDAVQKSCSLLAIIYTFASSPCTQQIGTS